LRSTQFWIDTLKPFYNICLEAGNTKGYLHTEDTKKKISAKHIGKVLTKEHRNNLSLALKGRKLSQNVLEKLKSRIITEEHRQKIGEALRGRTFTAERRLKAIEIFGKLVGVKINVLDVETNITTQYDTKTLAASALNTNRTTIGNYVESGKLYKNKYLIKKV